MQLELIRNDAVRPDAPDAFGLLFVHGAGCGAWVFENLLAWFAAAGVPAAALSLRGHGASEGRDRLRRFRIHDYVEDVANVLAGMESPPVVVGHSMGGLVVQKLVESNAVAGAVLLASSPVGGMLRDGLRMWHHWPGRVTLAIVRRSLLTLYATEASARWFLFRDATDPALIREARAMLQEESWRAILDMTVLVRPRPFRTHTPLLVLAGGEDRMVSLQSNVRTARGWGAELVIIDGCGHMLPTETVWPFVARRIRDWCRDKRLIES